MQTGKNFLYEKIFYSGKKVFKVFASDFFPKYEPIKNKISETVIPIVIWCRLKNLNPAA